MALHAEGRSPAHRPRRFPTSVPHNPVVTPLSEGVSSVTIKTQRRSCCYRFTAEPPSPKADAPRKTARTSEVYTLAYHLSPSRIAPNARSLEALRRAVTRVAPQGSASRYGDVNKSPIGSRVFERSISGRGVLLAGSFSAGGHFTARRLPRARPSTCARVLGPFHPPLRPGGQVTSHGGSERDSGANAA